MNASERVYQSHIMLQATVRLENRGISLAIMMQDGALSSCMNHVPYRHDQFTRLLLLLLKCHGFSLLQSNAGPLHLPANAGKMIQSPNLREAVGPG